MTGQVEENGHRTQQVQDDLTRLRAELTARLDRVDRPQPDTPLPTDVPPPSQAQAEEPAERPVARPPRQAEAPAVPASISAAIAAILCEPSIPR